MRCCTTTSMSCTLFTLSLRPAAVRSNSPSSFSAAEVGIISWAKRRASSLRLLRTPSTSANSFSALLNECAFAWRENPLVWLDVSRSFPSTPLPACPWEDAAAVECLPAPDRTLTLVVTDAGRSSSSSPSSSSRPLSWSSLQAVCSSVSSTPLESTVSRQRAIAAADTQRVLGSRAGDCACESWACTTASSSARPKDSYSVARSLKQRGTASHVWRGEKLVWKFHSKAHAFSYSARATLVSPRLRWCDERATFDSEMVSTALWYSLMRLVTSAS
mmetsp:Transcript_65021/g.130755  ORF Transcript_65021/g.130755 Transcript_65021/m.130755 type:complete len:274 (-) Transcript_65021:54-875(-)